MAKDTHSQIMLAVYDNNTSSSLVLLEMKIKST
jgi:hypothetical protein